jgi:hypothetical protein
MICGNSSTRYFRIILPTLMALLSLLLGPSRNPIFFRIFPHTTKLQESKRCAILTDAHLAIKYPGSTAPSTHMANAVRIRIGAAKTSIAMATTTSKNLPESSSTHLA